MGTQRENWEDSAIEDKGLKEKTSKTAGDLHVVFWKETKAGGKSGGKLSRISTLS